MENLCATTRTNTSKIRKWMNEHVFSQRRQRNIVLPPVTNRSQHWSLMTMTVDRHLMMMMMIARARKLKKLRFKNIYGKMVLLLNYLEQITGFKTSFRLWRLSNDLKRRQGRKSFAHRPEQRDGATQKLEVRK